MTSPDPLVSIIVPVYNSAPYLSRCVESLQAQSHANLELILVDDGSVDGSGTICDAAAARDGRIHVIHQANGGIGRAQNTGLDAMHGDYVTFCDNDDLMSPRLVERLLAIVKTARADMSQCRWANIGASVARARYLKDRASAGPAGRVVTFSQPARHYQSVFSKVERLVLRDGEFRYLNEANWSKLYRATLWDGLRFPEGVFAQDAYINTELYLRMTRVAACSDTLYYWIQHKTSVTHKTRSFKYHRDILDCAFHNIEVARSADILPKRSFYALLMERNLIQPSARSAEQRIIADRYRTRCQTYLDDLDLAQKLSVHTSALLRRLETFLYSKTIHHRS